MALNNWRRRWWKALIGLDGDPGEVPTFMDATTPPVWAMPAGRSGVLSPPNGNAALNAIKVITSGSAFAVYMGRAGRPLNSATLRYRVTTLASSITWSEVALAKGPIVIGGDPTLTVVGYTDTAAINNSTGQKSVAVNVANGQSIAAADDLWAVIGNSAIVPAIVRAMSIADDLQVGTQAATAARPSTIVGTPTVFTLESAVTLPAWISAVI